ncbi:hypothetical protein DRZ77_03365 [Candidatus Woesearchaeota archaeon]|nr:MAG: hypothetical protein DRZ77_03365 [Candidatus Woesearchaeota archaeon]
MGLNLVKVNMNIFELILETLPDFEKELRELKIQLQYQVKNNKLIIIDLNNPDVWFEIVNLEPYCGGCIIIRSSSLTLAYMLVSIINRSVRMYEIRDLYITTFLDDVFRTEFSIYHYVLCINPVCQSNCERILYQVIEDYSKIKRIEDKCHKKCVEEMCPEYRKYREQAFKHFIKNEKKVLELLSRASKIYAECILNSLHKLNKCVHDCISKYLDEKILKHVKEFMTYIK